MAEELHCVRLIANGRNRGMLGVTVPIYNRTEFTNLNLLNSDPLKV